MSEYIQNAVQPALEAKPTDFKTAIYSAIQQKVDDAMFVQKMQVANKIFNNNEESLESNSDLVPEEENVDEDL